MKIVDFGYSNCSTDDMLYPMWTDKDIINDNGEYICIFNCNENNYLVTYNKEKNKLIVNEIACDYRANFNELSCYYPQKKTKECLNYEKILNIELFKKKIINRELKVNNIVNILQELGIKNVSITLLDNLFVGMFKKWRENNESIELFGLKKKVFDKLKEINKQNISLYQSANNKKRR